MTFNVPPEETSATQKWWALLGVGLGLLMFTLDGSIVNLALPTLVNTLHTTFATIQWVVVSYLLVVTALVLGAARLGDMFGKKLLYLWGLILFTIASLLCGLAPSVEWLIAFRTLQGLGGLFIAALTVAIATEVFPPSERGKTLGIISAIVSLGICLGPTLGGLLIAIAGWRLIFLVNIPFGIFASFIIVRFVPQEAIANRTQQFDALGSATITISLLSFTLSMTQGQIESFTSIKTLTLLAIAVLSFAAFLFLEARINQPMLDLRMFENWEFSLSLLMGVLVFFAISGIIFILPFFFQLVLYYPAQKIGLLLAVSPVLTGIVAPFSGAMSDRFGSRIISLIGLVLMFCSCLLMSTFDAQLKDLVYIAWIAPLGIGFGMFQSPNNSAIMGSVPKERLGIASGLLSLSRTLGQTIALPLMGAIFAALTLRSANLEQNANVTAASPEALIYGVKGTFNFAALILGIAAALAVVVWRMEQKARQVS
ncbi:drug resistance transporter, EmrB/QacA subfamily [Cylindrospermum stagnale PCC 7417]|uniref:Drug resistance transporter, EmrB/QacA subfamily n=1 Tax=Cylindrospermum stagnale PCC 7417 TaxID=56107 RepID=K9WQE3_9NOST|nr:MFS transporter [Cylindrospermum stagnale]AFZ22403.1 drug resistance transporter, EmrB/QacA subfamily [Cylindrospermum stagnale PCC 7417]